MSRNIRKKHAQTPVKAARRRGSDSTTVSSLHLTDDDGYTELEDVSESDEDDEEHVYAAEEKYIITDAARKRSPPRPLPSEDDDADEELADDEGVDGDDDDDQDAAEGGVDDAASWNGIDDSELDSTTTEEVNKYLEQDMAAVEERHVRFTGVPDSDSDSTTSDISDSHQSFWPDIFIPQNCLDSAFRRKIEHDDDNSSTADSYWDYNPNDMFSDNVAEAEVDDSDNTPMATPVPSGFVSGVSTPVATPAAEEQELDGYESDGETTDEENEPELAIVRSLRPSPLLDESPDSEMEKATPVRRGRPRVGHFSISQSEKPVAVLNPKTRKMMIFTPQRRSHAELSPESFDMATVPAMDMFPLLADPGSVMMGAMLSSEFFGAFAGQQTVGPAEAFFPLNYAQNFDDDTGTSEYGEFAEDEEDQPRLDFEDFFCYGDERSEDEGEEETTEWNGAPDSSPSRPQTAVSAVSIATDASVADAPSLLSHFNKNPDAVCAFRRDQITKKLISSDQATQESIAFSGPLHMGTLRGIKTGSLETVTTPITPARRHKRSHTLSGPTLQPDLQGSPSQKRKASSQLTDNLHKKQRSISDMDLLQIR